MAEMLKASQPEDFCKYLKSLVKGEISLVSCNTLNFSLKYHLSGKIIWLCNFSNKLRKLVIDSQLRIPNAAPKTLLLLRVLQTKLIQPMSSNHVDPKCLISVPLMTVFSLCISEGGWALVFNDLSLVIIMLTIYLQ